MFKYDWHISLKCYFATLKNFVLDLFKTNYRNTTDFLVSLKYGPSQGAVNLCDTKLLRYLLAFS